MASSTRSIALVGEEPFGDVAVGERRRGDERGVRDPDAVMDSNASRSPRRIEIVSSTLGWSR